MTPDMADAHATARARGAGYTTHFTVTANGWVIDNQTGEFSRLNQESDMPEMTDVTSPAQLRHNGIVALLTEIRDRLPERVEVKVAPFDPDLVAANIAALKHELETPMREHGECCEPAPADGLPGEPVEPGDLRSGDRVEFTYREERITGALASERGLDAVLRSDTPGSGGYRPPVVVSRGWAFGISDVRLIEPAPREDEDPDEAAVWREHAERAEAEVKRVTAARDALRDDRDVWEQKAREAEAERDEWKARHEALRADVQRGARHWSTYGSSDRHRQRIARAAGRDLTGYLDRDDERAAKGEQR